MANADAAAYFFEDQAQNNDAQHSQVDSVEELTAADMPGLPAGCHASLAVGQQAVTKGRQGSRALNKVQVGCVGRLPRRHWVHTGCNRIPTSSFLHATCMPRTCSRPLAPTPAPIPPPHPPQVILCCIRLPQHGSDVLITLNSPIYISEHSAAAEHAGGAPPQPPQPPCKAGLWGTPKHADPFAALHVARPCCTGQPSLPCII